MMLKKIQFLEALTPTYDMSYQTLNARAAKLLRYQFRTGNTGLKVKSHVSTSMHR